MTKLAFYSLCIHSILFNSLLAFDGNAQKAVSVFEVTLKVDFEKATFDEVLHEIERKTDYVFSYDKEDFKDLDVRMSLEAKDMVLGDLLTHVSRAARVGFKQINHNIYIKKVDPKQDTPIEVVLQTTVVSGRVVSSDTNEGLPGVNILVKGANLGTITDADGAYSLEIPSSEDAVLIFSFVGYQTQEIPLRGRTVLDISMLPDIASLDEIVVVGYGTQNKVTVTGAVVSVKGDEIVKSKTPNVLNSLTGQMAGVVINNRSGEPGRDEPSVFIRGRSTTGDSNPLYIIDGVQRFDLGRLNPNDIESISVLKDASAAIYGARAANGVILVTTKRGQTGAPKFDFSFNQGFTEPTRNPRMADSYTFAKVYNEIEEAAGRPARYSETELQQFKAGTEPGYTTTNFYEEMTRDLTPQRQFNLSASGGNEVLNYYIALGQLSQEGHFNYGSTQLKRYNFRSNTDVKVSEYLTIGLDLSGRLDNRQYPENDTRGVYSHLYLYQPNWTLFWPGTNLKRPLRDNENIINWVSDAGGNQTEEYKGLESKLHFKLDIPWIKGLSIQGNGNYDVRNNFIKTWDLPTYVHYYNEDSDEYTEGRSGEGADLAQLEQYYDQQSIVTLIARINYEKSIGNHNLGVMVGYEQQEYNLNYFSAYRTDYPSDVLPELFAGSSDKNKQGNDGSAAVSSRQNYFGRVTYDYANKYLAQLIFRRDGSPNFPADQRWGFFPGVSLGWRLSEEAFMSNLGLIDDLKIRGSYGEMGNDSIPPFQYYNSYQYNPDYNYVIGGNDVTGLIQSGVANPNITWEVAQMTNIGFELSLWEGAFAIEADYFKTKRSNILTKRTAVIPDYTGLVLPDENVGIVENKGFEFQLLHRKSLNTLSYSIGGNISYAKNEVIFADEAPAAEDYQLATGKPIGAGLYYEAIGIFSSEEELGQYPTLPGAQPGDIIYRDMNEDGVLNSRDQVRLDQTSTPQIVYAINGSLNYANFDLSILFQGQERAMTNFNETDNYFPVMNYNLGNFLQWRADDRWSPENTDATQPRGAAENSNNNTQPSTHWVIDGGFLRFKNVELGYTFPVNLTNSIGIEYLRIYANGNNLFYVYDHMKDLGFDPETADYWFYPQQRIFNLGINLTF